MNAAWRGQAGPAVALPGGDNAISAFTVAVANQEKPLILGLLAWILPLVGFLQALFVYPVLLAADSTAKRLKEGRAML